jgi:hypothetical protein
MRLKTQRLSRNRKLTARFLSGEQVRSLRSPYRCAIPPAPTFVRLPLFLSFSSVLALEFPSAGILT